jgi:hypothetical protein
VNSEVDFLSQYRNVRPGYKSNTWTVQCPVCGVGDVLLSRQPDGERRLFFENEDCWAKY